MPLYISGFIPEYLDSSYVWQTGEISSSQYLEFDVYLFTSLDGTCTMSSTGNGLLPVHHKPNT